MNFKPENKETVLVVKHGEMNLLTPSIDKTQPGEMTDGRTLTGWLWEPSLIERLLWIQGKELLDVDNY